MYKEAGVEYRGRTFPGYNQPIASDKKNKKKMVLAKKDGKVKLIHFGQKGYQHNYSKSAKKNYLTRSAGIRNKSGELTMNDKHSPNYWSRKHLWPKRQKADGSALKKEASKKKESKEKKKKSLLHRGMGALAGGGMVLGSTPVISAMANPYHTMYHGTNLNSADLIFNNELEDGFRGLSTRFAGQAGRLNASMLANSATKALYDLDIPLTRDQEIAIVDKAMANMDATRGTPDFDSVKAVLDAAKEELPKSGVEPDKVDNVIDAIKGQVVKSGKRIYGSTGAHTVADWATSGNEADIAISKLNPLTGYKIQLKGLVNTLTGGFFPELNEKIKSFKFNRKANKRKANLTRQELGGVLKSLNAGGSLSAEDIKKLGLSAAEAEELKTLVTEGRLGTSIATRVPVGEGAMLNDFPGLNVAMAVNPGIKHTLGEFLPNMDPSKDLSYAEDIPIEHFRTVDLVDNKTGTPLRRIVLDSPQSPKISLKGLSKGLAKASPYAAIGALGLDTLQANLLDRDSYTTKGIRALANMGGQKKEASLFSGSTRRGLRASLETAKSVVPGALLGGAAGIGSDLLVEKGMDAVRGSEDYKKSIQDQAAANTALGMAADEAALAARVGARTAIGGPLAALGGAATALIPGANRRAIGGIVDVIKGKKLPSQLIDHARGVVGLPLTAAGGLVAASVAQGANATVLEGGDLTNVSPILAPLEGTLIGDKMKETPGLAATVPLAAMASVPIMGAYGLRKYYGGHLSKGLRAIDRKKEEIVGALRQIDPMQIPRLEPAELRNQMSRVSKMNLREKDYDKAVRSLMEGKDAEKTFRIAEKDEAMKELLRIPFVDTEHKRKARNALSAILEGLPEDASIEEVRQAVMDFHKNNSDSAISYDIEKFLSKL